MEERAFVILKKKKRKKEKKSEPQLLLQELHPIKTRVRAQIKPEM